MASPGRSLSRNERPLLGRSDIRAERRDRLILTQIGHSAQP